jgi:FKBP-type peptidyl-prolyl cis-trans isomerase (trigger factor)
MEEIKKLPKSEVEITIEAPREQFEKCYKEAVEELSKTVAVSGFRPGKVPEKILEGTVGAGAILKKAGEKAIEKTYFPFLLARKIEAIGKPEITIIKIARGNPFVYKIKTAVLPEIILPDYKKIAKEMKSGSKKPAEILEAICEAAEMEIAEVLIEEERENILRELKASVESTGLTWEDYLNKAKKNEEDLRKECRNGAARRIKYGLILRALAEKENIEVAAEELEKGISEILKKYPHLDPDYLKGYTYGIIRNEKVLKFLDSL